MKRLLPVVLLALIAFTSDAQHFPPVGATWKYDFYSPNFPFWRPYYPRTTWQVVKDTLIEGRLCRKAMCTYTSPGGWQEPGEQSTYVHESNDSLYEYSLTDNKFHFYFDYTAQEGDTLVLEQVTRAAKYDTTSYIVDTIVMVSFESDPSVKFKEYVLRPLQMQFGIITRYVHDRFFAVTYNHVMSDAGTVWGIPEQAYWGLRCYSDSTYPSLRYMYAGGQGCDGFTYRPIEGISLFGNWTWSLPRATANDPTSFLKVDTRPGSENGIDYLELIPALNGIDSIPEGKVRLVEDEVGMLILHNDSVYRLYDFSLSVGDTGIAHCGPFSAPWLALNGQNKVPSTIKRFRYVVTEVYYNNTDSHNVGGNNIPRKMRVRPVPVTPADTALYADWQFNGPIYEGIGCITSLFGEPAGSPAAFDTGFVRCYRPGFDLTFVNNKTIKQNLGCDELRTAVASAASPAAFSVYPNPSTGWLNIRSSDNIAHSEISVYDMRGRCVHRSHAEINAHKPLKIDLSEAPGGLYIVSLKQGNSVSHQKVIIQR